MSGCSRNTKKIWIAQEIVRAGRRQALLLPRPRFQPFESKFHRDSDFETPVAIFVLQVERYTVTSGIVGGAIDQAEPINNTFVDGALDDLIVAVIEVETGLCHRGCRR
ncbi:MAG: hypothetical protein DME88_02710 [Verrucomicrobia bacterium]|nr:MAG: hypothetical protein DME88_02710 [Verrucomicrobiota bacterium]